MPILTENRLYSDALENSAVAHWVTLALNLTSTLYVEFACPPSFTPVSYSHKMYS